MRAGLKLLLSVSLLFSACDDSGEELESDAGPIQAAPGLSGGGTPGLGGPGGGTTGAPTAPAGLGGTSGTGGAIAGSGGTTGSGGTFGGGTPGLPGGGVSGMQGGAIPVDAGTPGASADASPGSSPGGGPTVSGPGPMIPKPNGQCPVFQSGVTTIHGLSVNVYAGPKTPGKAGPLVFHWHGTGGAGDNVERSPFGGSDGAGLPDEVRAEILAEGGIIISPTDDDSVREGSDVTFILGVWYTPGDLELADLVVACAVEQQLIDPRRIYTTGCSAGGLMAGVMGFHRSSYLAASAPNSGGVVAIIPGMTTFQDMHTPALMTMHGEMDEVFVNFKDTSRDADTAFAARGGFVINCNHGGGHCAAPKDLKLAMWQFMKDHPFGVDPEPYANGLPATFPSYCQIVKQ